MLEAAFWCAAGLLAGPVAGWAARRVPALKRAAPLGPWAHGLILPFAALMRGAVTPREFGLSGHAGQDWLIGSLFAGALVAAGAVMALRRRTYGWERLDPVDAVLDEGRWGLYRAWGVAWTSARLPGAAVGLVLALLEGFLRSGGAVRPQAWAAANPLALLRPASSFLFFILTGNAWLTAIGQTVLILAVGVLSGRRRDTGSASTVP
jgi:hypothetical protein